MAGRTRKTTVTAVTETALVPLGETAVPGAAAVQGAAAVTGDLVGAVLGEAADDLGSLVPHIVQMVLEDKYHFSTAANQTELIPAPAKPGNTQQGGLKKTDYRTMCLHAVNLAEGGEGLFSNFVEQMVESVAGGFVNRYASQNLGETNPGTGDGGGDGTKTPKATPPGGKKGKTGGGENFLGIFDTFCRNVNADQNGRSIPGRQRGIDSILSQWVWHNWTTSMMVVLYRWGSVRVPELNYRPFQVPVEMEFLDPQRVDLDDFRSRGIVWYEMPRVDSQRIQNDIRKNYGGKPDQHPFFAMYPKKGVGNLDKQTEPVKKAVPENIFSAEEAYAELVSKNRIPLPPENVKVYRRSFNSAQIYPMPFASRIFAPVNDKRMLRTMDRSLMRKVIMMILQVSVGSPDPKRMVREKDLQETAKRIEAQLAADPEYLQVLATPEKTEIKWVIPDSSVILDRQKYVTVDFEILAALVGLVANQLLNQSGTLDMTLIGKTLFQKNQRCIADFKLFMQELYDEIILKNNLRAIKPTDVALVFRQISLYEADAFKTFVFNMCSKGLLPARVAIENMGEDYDTVLEELVRESILRKQYDILTVPPTNNQVTNSDPNTSKKAPPGGRPTGTPESTPKAPADSTKTTTKTGS